MKGCIHKIRINRLELPSLRQIESLVLSALDSVNKIIYNHLDKALSNKQKRLLNELVEESPDKKIKSKLSLIKLVPGRATIIEANTQKKLLSRLKEFRINKETMGKVSVQKIEWFAKQGKEYNIRDLRNFSAAKRHAILACFIYKNMTDTIDNLVRIYIKKMRIVHSKAQTKFQNNLVRDSTNSTSKMKVLHDITNRFLENWEEPPKVFKRQIVSYKPKSEFEKINIEVREYVYERSDAYCYLIRSLSHIRAFCKKVLSCIKLNSDTSNNKLLSMLSMVKKKWKNKNMRFRVDMDTIDYEWRRYVFDEGGKFSYMYFEIYVLSKLATALRSGEIWVEGSNEFSSLYSHLLTKEEWGNVKGKYLEEINIPSDKKKFVDEKKASLNHACLRFGKGIKGNHYANIKSNKLYISPLDRAKIPYDIIALKRKIIQIIGKVNLTDILIDVQIETNFCNNFKHIAGKVTKNSPKTIERLLAALHSSACNLGPMQTAKSTEFTEMQIITSKKFYLTEKNLRDANNQIVNLYNKLSITNSWGDGSSVSADGRMIKMVDKNLMASWNVKYHGVGGMLYNHVSDKYIAIYSQFINCGVYEAEYILDALFNEDNEIDVKPTKIHADTHGQTEMLFGFCTLLGISLMPRIKNIKKYILYKPETNSKYSSIDPILRRAIDWNKIYSALDIMLMICASIRYGKVRSSLILKKLTTYRRANKIYEGFRELGRVARTIYILNYANSKEIRRMVQLGCNKAEMWNNLQKFVYFGQSGELRINDVEDQRDSTTALEMVCNCVAYWNAKKIKESFDNLKENDPKVNQKSIRYITPMITRHINRFGKFEFDIEKRNKNVPAR